MKKEGIVINGRNLIVPLLGGTHGKADDMTILLKDIAKYTEDYWENFYDMAKTLHHREPTIAEVCAYASFRYYLEHSSENRVTRYHEYPSGEGLSQKKDRYEIPEREGALPPEPELPTKSGASDVASLIKRPTKSTFRANGRELGSDDLVVALSGHTHYGGFHRPEWADKDIIHHAFNLGEVLSVNLDKLSKKTVELQRIDGTDCPLNQVVDNASILRVTPPEEVERMKFYIGQVVVMNYVASAGWRELSSFEEPLTLASDYGDDDSRIYFGLDKTAWVVSDVTSDSVSVRPLTTYDKVDGKNVAVKDKFCEITMSKGKAKHRLYKTERI